MFPKIPENIRLKTEVGATTDETFIEMSESKNKCEEMGIAHAWRNADRMWGMSMSTVEKCANCDLERTHCSEMKEWWSYSDSRPNEPIINVRPV